MKSVSKYYLIIAFAFFIIFGFLVYEVWHVFGWKAMIISILVNSVMGTALKNLIGCKSKTADGYMFNPVELPKYLAMFASFMVGIYLYIQLGNPELSSNDWRFGILWIALCIILPVGVQTVNLIRDRNDFVKISEHLITYRDNEKHGEFFLKDLKQAEFDGGGDVKLIFLDGREQLIKTSEMNFGSTDLAELVKTINEVLPSPDTPV